MRKTPCTFVDITGQVFNGWTVLERVANRYKTKVYYKCQCFCGTITEVGKRELTSGKSKNCGCTTRKSKRDGSKWSKRWTKEEDERIRQWYPINGGRQVAKFLGRSLEAVRARANRLDIKLNKPIYSRNDKWSEGELQKLKELWPKGGYEACYGHFPFRSKHAVKDKAHRLKLRIGETSNEVGESPTGDSITCGDTSLAA